MEICPKCKAEMEAGLLAGNAGWASVVPGASFWTRLKWATSVKRIAAFRCKKCGFLELYAKQDAQIV